MKLALCAAAVAVAAVALSGCGTLKGLVDVNEKAAPEVQQTQAASNAAFTKAITDRLEHCTLIGNVNLKVAARVDAGLENTLGLNCPAKPWEAGPAVPLSQLGPPQQ